MFFVLQEIFVENVFHHSLPLIWLDRGFRRSSRHEIIQAVWMQDILLARRQGRSRIYSEGFRV